MITIKLYTFDKRASYRKSQNPYLSLTVSPYLNETMGFFAGCVCQRSRITYDWAFFTFNYFQNRSESGVGRKISNTFYQSKCPQWNGFEPPTPLLPTPLVFVRNRIRIQAL